MSGYIVCHSPSMFLEPANANRTNAHHYRRPLHQQRHRHDDRRFVHQGVAVPQPISHNVPRNHFHHRYGAYNHLPALHHQHPAGDFAVDYYFQLQHHQQPHMLPPLHINGHHLPGVLRYLIHYLPVLDD